MQTRNSRIVAAALIAALALTSLDIVPAQSAPKNNQPQKAQSTATTTDFSARRRHYSRGNAATVAAVIGVFGAIAAIAAADRYRDDYYYGNPGYGAYGYAPGYRYRYEHHRRHWH